MRHWLGTSKGDLASFMDRHGQPGYRVGQVHGWLHARRAASFDEMKNLPAPLRRALADEGVLRSLIELERRDTADRLTSKWLFAAPRPGDETESLIESVLIIEKQRRRRTVCVSCMAGCPLACAFCATGGQGFVRNLDAGEIVEQVYRIDAHARAGDGPGVSHVVFMGMGEPLLNLDNVLAAADAFGDPAGLGLSGRRITISTVGVPDGIRRLAESGRNYRLALSLHAPTQSLREKLVPAAKRWPLPLVFKALEQFAAATSRVPTFEYCLIDGVNASPENAKQLAKLLKPLPAKVNLIPLNPVPGFNAAPPPPRAVAHFRDTLESAGVHATIRVEKGAEIAAACGQLKAEQSERPKGKRDDEGQ